MKSKIFLSENYERKLKRLSKKYSSLNDDLAPIYEQLKETPLLGTALGNNCFKIRVKISSKGKGKSGGGRIITYFIREQNSVYLLDIYDKSEQADISSKNLKELVQLILG